MNINYFERTVPKNLSDFDGLLFLTLSSDSDGKVNEKKLHEIAMFCAGVQDISDNFSSYGVTQENVSYVAENLPNFNNVIDFFNGFAKAKSIISNHDEDPIELSIDDHLTAYKALNCDSDNNCSWAEKVSHLAEEAHSKGLYMIHAFKAIEHWNDINSVSGFLEYIKNLNELGETHTLDEFADGYKQFRKSLVQVPIHAFRAKESNGSVSPFDMEKETHMVPEESLYQEKHRDDPLSFKDNSHLYEHLISHADR